MDAESEDQCARKFKPPLLVFLACRCFCRSFFSSSKSCMRASDGNLPRINQSLQPDSFAHGLLKPWDS